MQGRLCQFAVSVLVLFGIDSAVQGQNFKYQEFVPAGSTQTVLASINARGDVVGIYYDLKSVQHGFYRSAGGSIFSVDPPESQGTIATGIDGRGDIPATTETRMVPFAASFAAVEAPTSPSTLPATQR